MSAEATAQARFSEQQVERFTHDISLAHDHIVGRNRRVAQVLCYVSLMRNAGCIQDGAVVACRGAAAQHFSAAGGNQAAHYLPGVIMVGSHPLWMLTRHGPTRAAIQTCFADVQDLHANFNKADSAAEGSTASNGLKSAFGQAAAMLACALPGRPGVVDRSRAARAMRQWKLDSERCYRAAADRKSVHAPRLLEAQPMWTEAGALEPRAFTTEMLEANDAESGRVVRSGSRGKVLAQDYANQARYLEAGILALGVDVLTDRLIRAIEESFTAA